MKTKPENKFAAILQARHDSPGAEPDAIPPPPASSPIAPTVTTATVEEAPKRIGRPAGKGKSSDPAFQQVTAYIPKELHNNATIALRLANQIRVDTDKEDFSELITRLLANWYEKQTFYRPDK